MMDLTSFVRTMRQTRMDDCDPKMIGRLLTDVRVHEHDWSALPTRTNGYTRTCLYRDAQLEILILRWSAGSASAIHDHAGQRCWFTTLRGSFDLTNYRRVSGGRVPGYARIEPIETLTGVTIGEPDYRFGEEEIHRVTADSSDGAVSLHVYAQPLETCLVFDEPAERCTRKPLAYDGMWGSDLAVRTR